jgi:hypothetical protein
MNQGRFGFLPGRAGSAWRAWSAATGLLLCAAAGWAAAPGSVPRADGLRLTWAAPNHASGIYYVQEEGAVTVLVDNPGAKAAELSGEIVLGGRIDGADGDAGFKVLSVTPIATAMIQGGQRAKIPLPLTFGAAGTYELRWRRGDQEQPIDGDTAGWNLECIFAPRSAAAAGKAEDTPWVTMLPRAAAHHAGYLADYAQRTTVRRFVIDERFSFDAEKNLGLGFGAATGASVKEIDALLAEAAGAKAKLILRVTLPAATGTAAADARTVAAFREYVADAARRGKGALAALTIVPEGEATEAQQQHFRACYLAAYEAAKRADKNLALWGAGSAALTQQWLGEANLAANVDAVAIGDAAAEPPAARAILKGAKKALELLPPRGSAHWPPAAAGMAAGAVLVPAPPPAIDHGVTAHLLGGAALLERLRVTVPTANPAEPDSTNIPFVAVFQGDGYAVAAIAGFGAGTDLDGLYPALAQGRTEAGTTKAEDGPARPTLNISDDTRTMRVVDSAGAPVDCRVGDSLMVPAEDEVMYVLQGGTAADLAGSLRVAVGSGLPVFEAGVTPTADGVTVRLRNVATKEMGGTVRLIQSSDAAQGGAVVMAEKDFAAVGPGQTREIPMGLSRQEIEALRGPVVVEIRTTGAKPVLQRTAVPLGPPRP